MDNVLSRVEREVVLRYLRDDSVPLVIQQKENPAFVATLLKDQYIVLNEGIILIKNPPIQWMATDFTPVEIRFYFKKRGLFFSSTLRHISAGMAIVISPEIRKQNDDVNIDDYQLTAVLFFSCAQKDDLHINCCPRANHPLFESRTWKAIAPTEIKEVVSFFEEFTNGHLVKLPSDFSDLVKSIDKLLYLPNHKFPERKPLPSDICILFDDLPKNFLGSPSALPFSVYLPIEDSDSSYLACNLTESFSIFDVLQIIPVCRFFAEEAEEKNRVNEDRIEPLSILFISDKTIVFGGSFSSLQLQQGQEYGVKITVKTSIGYRDLFTTCSVKRIYSDYKFKNCAVCEFTSIKPEDSRLLFERTYKNVFQGNIK